MIAKKLFILCFATLTLSVGGFLIAGTISNNSSPVSAGYTLEDIYNLIQNNPAASHTLLPNSSPATPTMHSVSEIYVALANLINPASTTVTYLGVAPGSSITLVSAIAKDFTPTTVPGVVTGFTLQDIANLITGTRITTPAHSFSPSSDPSDSASPSLSDIYSSLSTLISSSSVATGTVYLGVMGSHIFDITPPQVTEFTVPAISSSLTVNISAFTATDNIAVTGYLVSASSSAPALDDPNWTSIATTTYTFATAGDNTLYAWAKDAAGNISASSNRAVTVNGILPYITYNGSNLYIYPQDETFGLPWGCFGTALGASSTDNGSYNTALIISSCSDTDIAAKACSSLDFGGYTDWYLPAKDQLGEVMRQKDNINPGDYAYVGVGRESYWSSTEAPIPPSPGYCTPGDCAYLFWGVNGDVSYGDKSDHSYSTRCVRSD